MDGTQLSHTLIFHTPEKNRNAELDTHVPFTFIIHQNIIINMDE